AGARIEIEHILVVHADAALGDGRADGPGRVGAVDAIGAGAQIEGTHTQRVHGMAARHPARQARILGDHGGRRRPGRIDALVGHLRHAFPAALLARDGNRVADGLARRRDEVEPPIREADDNLTLLVLRAETHDFAAAAGPVPEQLRRCRPCSQSGQRQDRSGQDRPPTQRARDDHRLTLLVFLSLDLVVVDPATAPVKTAFSTVPQCASDPALAARARTGPTGKQHWMVIAGSTSLPRWPEASGVCPSQGREATQGNVIRAWDPRPCSRLCAFSHMVAGPPLEFPRSVVVPRMLTGFPSLRKRATLARLSPRTAEASP